MKETGKIVGKICNNIVTFEKLMPKNSRLNLNGERELRTQNHPTIYNSGKLSENKKEINGVWKFKIKIGLIFGVIPIIYRPGKGTWAMTLD